MNFKRILGILGNQNQRNKQKKNIINILTRTSGRPIGFKKMCDSIKDQTNTNFNQIVSYESIDDLEYLKLYEVKLIVVEKKSDNSHLKLNVKHEPYNLYCNDLLREVQEGWIIFLDDDDMLAHKRVLMMLHQQIKKHNDDTLFIWQTKFPDGSLLPPNETFEKKELKIEHIDTACFMFHSKYKNKAKWDAFWAADFRFIKDLADVIPNQKWIKRVFTLKNNFGDGGRRNDVNM